MKLLLCHLLSLFLSLTSANNPLPVGEPPQLITPQHPNVYVYDQDRNDGDCKHKIGVIPCPLVNDVNVSYQWFRDGQPVSAEMIDQTGTVSVYNISESWDGVEYYCVASRTIGKNPFTAAVRSRTIKVFYATFGGFEQRTQKVVFVSVALNSQVALECDVVSASPPPNYRWRINGKIVGEIRQQNYRRFFDGGRWLFLGKLQPANLEVTYRCEVTNAYLHRVEVAPTTYRLVDNMTPGQIVEYKEIGDLTAFIGNESIEFGHISGGFDTQPPYINSTGVFLSMNDNAVDTLARIGKVSPINAVGVFRLTAILIPNGIRLAQPFREGTLTVRQLPHITKSPMTNRDLVAGIESLKYTCEFEGYPTPEIQWFFNGESISPESGVSVINNSLMIASPQVYDSGIYQCIVSNEDGDDHASWLLEIRPLIQPVVMESNSMEMTASEDRDLGALIVQDNGTTVNFFVIVMADPCPNITWFFNSTPLVPSNSTFMFNDPCTEANARSPEWNFTLSVSPLTQETSGSYTASLTNQAGTTELPTPAYFTIPAPVSVTGLTLSLPCLKKGQNITLHCNVSGFPRPYVQFEFNDKPITPGQGIYANFIEQTFYDEITILNVNSSAEGLYSCSANSCDLRSTKQYKFCTVPSITELTATSRLVIGNLFLIQCAVTGTPTPMFTWRKDGRALTSSNDEVLMVNSGKTSKIYIPESGVEVNGSYECIARNDVGSDRNSLYFNVTQL